MRLQAYRIIVIVLSCLLAEVGLYADEQYPLRRLEVEDGLSQNMVYCICQDSHEFMWFGTQDGLNRYDGNSFKVFRKGGHGQLGNDSILCMDKGGDGRLWIGTLHGLFIYDPVYEDFASADVSGRVRDVVATPSGDVFCILDERNVIGIKENGERVVFQVFPEIAERNIRSICSDDENTIWGAGYQTGLFSINSKGETVAFHYSKSGDDLFTKVIRKDSENLIIGTMDNGVLEFNLRTHTFSQVPGLGGKTVNFIHDILLDSTGKIWAGAENGLFIWDNGRITHLTHIPNNPYSISDNAVFSIEEDSEGGIWIGTYFGGINYYSQYQAQFRKYFPIPGYNKLVGKNIGEFLESADGSIWIGTEDAGLHRLNPASGEFENGFINASNIHALAELDGKLWVGTYGNGLYTIDPRSGAKRNIVFSKLGYSQMDDNIYSIFRDMDGSTLIGTDGGLYEYRTEDNRLIRIEPNLINGSVNDICQDFYGNIWVATAGWGVFRKDGTSGKWTRTGTRSQYITCILEDSRHDIWFGTEDYGVLHYNHASSRFEEPFSVDTGLPDKMVYMLLEDASGNIWGSTNHGLFRLSPSDSKVLVFDHNSGLTCDQYNFRSGLKTRDGGFYFGGVKGFVGFHPDEILWPDGESKIVFNRFLLNHREIDLRSKESPIQESITLADRVVLRPGQDVFSIGFADLNYPISSVRSYQYRMTGVDKDWFDAGKSRLITFSEIKPGKYTLEVRANSYTEASGSTPCSIDIQILAPWYHTWWAYLLYALLFMGVASGVTYLIILTIRKRNKGILEKMEREKEKDLYDSKIRFFTNITHEIRTPLTLITAPLDEIMEKTGKDSPVFNDLSIVQKNSQRLLTLVNELLDFRKVEAGNILPNFIHKDIVSIVNATVERFMPRIEAENLEFRKVIPDRLEADVDSEIFTKILSNILGNACKHAANHISLKLECNEDMLKLSILNDGDRIPGSESEHIFDPFVKLYENVPGSGIGLPFARTLASTHGGNIYLDTESEETCFVVELPLIQENVVLVEDTDESEPDNETSPVEEDGREKILIVDDNEDFRDFLSRKLGERYSVFTASDGKEAREILGKEMIDLVVTDLMMPGMDGASLCTSIKEDINTSHIPVILVTAKSDMNTRIECIRKGADDFIPKPFQTSYLLVRIENMLKARENLKKAFSSSPDFSFSEIATSSRDEEFISQLKSIIESRMEDPALDVDILADSMNMSRATFYRKMKGISDVSPNEFIKLCRLRKAAELLAAGNTHINEIAYSVGFSSPSYFSRSFSKQFGVSPKDYVAK